MKKELSIMITKKEAKKIAEDYVRENKIAFDIGNMFQYDELKQGKLNIYLTEDINISDCWCAGVVGVNVHPGLLHSSSIILISKKTGSVVYCGSANDEG